MIYQDWHEYIASRPIPDFEARATEFAHDMYDYAEFLLFGTLPKGNRNEVAQKTESIT